MGTAVLSDNEWKVRFQSLSGRVGGLNEWQEKEREKGVKK
jgi:hypothetical protein